MAQLTPFDPIMKSIEVSFYHVPEPRKLCGIWSLHPPGYHVTIATTLGEHEIQQQVRCCVWSLWSVSSPSLAHWHCSSCQLSVGQVKLCDSVASSDIVLLHLFALMARGSHGSYSNYSTVSCSPFGPWHQITDTTLTALGQSFARAEVLVLLTAGSEMRCMHTNTSSCSINNFSSI